MKTYLWIAALLLAVINIAAGAIKSPAGSLFGGLFLNPDTKEMVVIYTDPADGLTTEVYLSQNGQKPLRYEIMSQESGRDGIIWRNIKLFRMEDPDKVLELELVSHGIGDCTMKLQTAKKKDQRQLLRLATEEETFFDPDDTPGAALAMAMTHLHMQFYDPEHNVYAENIPVRFGGLEDPSMFELAVGEGEEQSSLFCSFEQDLTILMGNEEIDRSYKAIIGKLKMLSGPRWCLSLYDAKGNHLSSFAQPE